MALTRAQKNIVREIQTLHPRRLPLNISAVKRSHPNLMKRVYAVRPYWGWKQALEDAGLSYATINTEVRDYVDCKICGRDLGMLPFHLITQHQVTSEEYRQEYPEAELVSETIRAGIARRRQRKRPMLPQWEAVWTPEYILDRMVELHRQNFPLNWAWAHEHGKALAVEAVIYFGSWDEALRRIDRLERLLQLGPVRPSSYWRSITATADAGAFFARESARNRKSLNPVFRPRASYWKCRGGSFHDSRL